MKEIHHCKGLYAWCECKCAGGTRDYQQRSIEGLCPHCVENVFVDAVRSQRPPRQRTTRRRKPAKSGKARGARKTAVRGRYD